MESQSKSANIGPAVVAIACLAILAFLIARGAFFQDAQPAADLSGVVAVHAPVSMDLPGQREPVTVYVVPSASSAEALRSLFANQRVTEPPPGGYSVAIAESPEDIAGIISYLHGNAEIMPFVLAYFSDPA